MEVKDLMIGDWIHNNYTNENYQVWPAFFTQATNFGKRLDATFEDINIAPIPLTPEILEKNGWYHAKFDESYGRKAMRIDGYYQDELPKGVDNALSFAQWSIDEKFMYHMLEIFMWVGSIHLKIEYVHELQHALRICGIEKKEIIL